MRPENALQPRYCEDCDYKSEPFKDAPPKSWLCTKFRRREGFGFVSRTFWDDKAPFKFCREINTDGSCPLWTPARDEQMEIGCD